MWRKMSVVEIRKLTIAKIRLRPFDGPDKRLCTRPPDGLPLVPDSTDLPFLNGRTLVGPLNSTTIAGVGKSRTSLGREDLADLSPIATVSYQSRPVRESQPSTTQADKQETPRSRRERSAGGRAVKSGRLFTRRTHFSQGKLLVAQPGARVEPGSTPMPGGLSTRRVPRLFPAQEALLQQHQVTAQSSEGETSELKTGTDYSSTPPLSTSAFMRLTSGSTPSAGRSSGGSGVEQHDRPRLLIRGTTASQFDRPGTGREERSSRHTPFSYEEKRSSSEARRSINVNEVLRKEARKRPVTHMRHSTPDTSPPSRGANKIVVDLSSIPPFTGGGSDDEEELVPRPLSRDVHSDEIVPSEDPDYMPYSFALPRIEIVSKSLMAHSTAHAGKGGPGPALDLSPIHQPPTSSPFSRQRGVRRGTGGRGVRQMRFCVAPSNDDSDNDDRAVPSPSATPFLKPTASPAVRHKSASPQHSPQQCPLRALPDDLIASKPASLLLYTHKEPFDYGRAVRITPRDILLTL